MMRLEKTGSLSELLKSRWEQPRPLEGWLTKTRRNLGSTGFFGTKRYFRLEGTKLSWHESPDGKLLGQRDVGGATIEHTSKASFVIHYATGRRDELRCSETTPTAKEWVVALRIVSLKASLKLIVKPPSFLEKMKHIITDDSTPVKVFPVKKYAKDPSKALERRVEVQNGSLYNYDVSGRLKKEYQLSRLDAVEKSRFVPQQLVLRWRDRPQFRLEFRTIRQAETFYQLLAVPSRRSRSAPKWLRIRICTWNVGNRMPSSDLSPWLRFPPPDVSDKALDDLTEDSSRDDDDDDESDEVSSSESDDDEGLDDDDDDFDSEEEEDEDDDVSVDQHVSKEDKRTMSLPKKDDEDDLLEDIIVVGSQESTYNLKKELSSEENSPLPRNTARSILAQLKSYSISAESCASAFTSSSEKKCRSKNDHDDWVKVVSQEFQGYVIKCEVTFWEMRLLVFVKRVHAKYTSTVETDHVGCGIGDRLGNKGAIAAALSIYDTTLCFVNSHLEANQLEVRGRNDDFAKIVDSLKLGRRELDILSQFDHVFWFGDLNYRCDLSPSVFFEHPASATLVQPAWDPCFSTRRRKPSMPSVRQCRNQVSILRWTLFSDLVCVGRSRSCDHSIARDNKNFYIFSWIFFFPFWFSDFRIFLFFSGERRTPLID